MSKPKIFLSYDPATNWGPNDVIVFALAEDGTGLGSHLSSNEVWAKHDIGLTSDWHHDAYREHYPDGYELEWIPPEMLGGHEGFQKAMQFNCARYGKEKGVPA